MRDQSQQEALDVAIVGGGVTGLYCAWRLLQRRRDARVAVFEMSDTWGGRIETRLMGDGKFKAEFGPMRYEEKGQEKLIGLLGELGLEFSPFPQYRSSAPQWPQYKMATREEARWGGDPLNLMRMGILKVLGRYRDGMSLGDMHREIGSLGEEQYPAMRRTARLRGERDGELLHESRLWNAFSEVMSHQAVLKLRDVGNFYHLIPDNPNAIEWIIFWLRGLQPEDRLVGIKGGSHGITKKLCEKLSGGDVLRAKHTLADFGPDGDRVRLRFVEGAEVIARHVILAVPQLPLERLADHLPPTIRADLGSVMPIRLLKVFFVVDKPWWNEFTLPQTGATMMPTRELHYYQEHALQLDQQRAPEYRELLDRAQIDERIRGEFTAHGIDLPARVYVVRVQSDGTDIGWQLLGSEVSKTAYFIRRQDLSVFDKNGRGMVMVYTDRPARSYWSHYIEDPANHHRAELNGDRRLVDRFMQYLASHVSMELDGREVRGETPPEPLAALVGLHGDALVRELTSRVVEFGIHDWGKPPFGAASHAWQPGAKSWEVLERFEAFNLAAGGPKNVHICGEAYSDYHGFIEGCLMSADRALETITLGPAAS